MSEGKLEFEFGKSTNEQKLHIFRVLRERLAAAEKRAEYWKENLLEANKENSQLRAQIASCHGANCMGFPVVIDESLKDGEFYFDVTPSPTADGSQ